MQHQQQQHQQEQQQLNKLSSLRPDQPGYYQRVQRLDHDVYMACDRLSKKNLYAIRLYQLEELDEIDLKLLTHLSLIHI